MKNVVLITIDSLRADHLSCLGYHRKTTPNIDDLAKDGVLFTNAISCGPDTLASIVPMLISSYVQAYYMYYVDFTKLKTMVEGFEELKTAILEIYGHRTTIAEVLKSYGYNTAAFHSNPLLSRYYNFGRDFDHFDDFFYFGGFKKYSIKRKIRKVLERNARLYRLAGYIYDKVRSDYTPRNKAEAVNRRVVSWLKECKKQFFVWVHYMDVHFPYKPSKEFQFNSKPVSGLEMSNLCYKMIYKPEELSGNEIRDIIDLYDGAISYTDYAIKSLLDELSEMDILNNTIIIITSDHGEEFGDHGDFAHHHAKLYDESIRVPLIIANTEYKNIAIDEPVSHLDIATTILDLLSISPAESFQGRSLIPIIRGEKKSSGVISESLRKEGRNICYRTKEWKYILNEGDAQRELYNIESDPKEKENLYEEGGGREREFELKIRRHISKQERMMKGLIDEKEKIKKRTTELKNLGKI